MSSMFLVAMLAVPALLGITVLPVMSPSLALGAASNGSAVHRYAEYGVSSDFIRFSDHVVGATEGLLLWRSLRPAGSEVEFINVTLSIANLTSTLRFNCTGNRLSFNESYYGANVFEAPGLKAGQSVDLGSSAKSQSGVARGPYDEYTPYGLYSSWLVEIQVESGNGTITSGYMYHAETGLLLHVGTPGGWLFSLFGVEVIFGDMRLSTTNIDLGSPNIGPLIGDVYFALVFVIGPIVIIAVVYRHKHKHERLVRTRRWK